MALKFDEYDQLPDVLLDDRFELFIEPKGKSTGLMEALTIRCQAAAFPGSDIEALPVGLNGHTLHFRGRKLFGGGSGQLQVAYVETRDGVAYKAIKNWQEYIVGTNSGSGAKKKEYSTSATLKVYNEGDEEALIATFDNLWPMSLGDIPLNGAMAQPFMLTVVFQYDRIKYDGVEVN
jgi:hypothetical protein